MHIIQRTPCRGQLPVCAQVTPRAAYLNTPAYPRTVSHAQAGLMVSGATNWAEFPTVSPKSSYSIPPSSVFGPKNQILHLFLSRFVKFHLCSCHAYEMFTQSLAWAVTRIGLRAGPCST